MQLEVYRLQALCVLLHTSNSLLQELSLNLLKALDWYLRSRIALHLRILYQHLQVLQKLRDALLTRWHLLLANAHHERSEGLYAARAQRRISGLRKRLVDHVGWEHGATHLLLVGLRVFLSEVVEEEVTQVRFTLLFQDFEEELFVVTHKLLHFLWRRYEVVFENASVRLFTLSSPVQVLTCELLCVVRKVAIGSPMAILRQIEPAQFSSDRRWFVQVFEGLLLVVLLENTRLLGVERLVATLHLARLAELHMTFIFSLIALVLALDRQF